MRYDKATNQNEGSGNHGLPPRMEGGVGAGGLTLSDMGTMNNGGGQGGAGFERGESNAPDGNGEASDGQTPARPDSGESAAAPPNGMDGDFTPPEQAGDTRPNPEQGGSAVQGWLWSGICAAVLLAALLFALLYKKRR